MIPLIGDNPVCPLRNCAPANPKVLDSPSSSTAPLKVSSNCPLNQSSKGRRQTCNIFKITLDDALPLGFCRCANAASQSVLSWISLRFFCWICCRPTATNFVICDNAGCNRGRLGVSERVEECIWWKSTISEWCGQIFFFNWVLASPCKNACQVLRLGGRWSDFLCGEKHGVRTPRYRLLRCI